MGKSSLCLQMLQLLNTGRIYKCSELADILETNSRNIIEYKKELEEAGYYITSIPGKYGGYKLEKTCLIPSIKLTESEKKSVADAYEFILKTKEFIYKKEFQTGISKFFSSANIFSNSNLLVVDKYQSVLDEEEIKKRYLLLETAINKKISVEIIEKGKKVEINPYKLFIYGHEWAVIAWSINDADFLFYKLSDFEEYNLLNKKFIVNKYFDFNKYFDNGGLVGNKNSFIINLLVTNEALSLFKTKIIGKNQQLSMISKKKGIVTLEMQNKQEIISLVLSLGTDVEVVEPVWLKEEIINISKKIISKYEK